MSKLINIGPVARVSGGILLQEDCCPREEFFLICMSMMPKGAILSIFFLNNCIPFFFVPFRIKSSDVKNREGVGSRRKDIPSYPVTMGLPPHTSIVQNNLFYTDNTVLHFAVFFFNILSVRVQYHHHKETRKRYKKKKKNAHLKTV